MVTALRREHLSSSRLRPAQHAGTPDIPGSLPGVRHHTHKKESEKTMIDLTTSSPQPSSKNIALIGIGMGGGDGATMTTGAAEFCREAGLLIGARRMLESIPDNGQRREAEYRAAEIAALIEKADETQIAVLLSGDVGFFSGAKKLLELLPDDVKVYAGISSVVYFCSKLHIAWEDAVITSSHGRRCNLIGEIRRSAKVFSILGTGSAVRELCDKLTWYGLTDVEVCVGEDLSYPEEKILRGKPEEFLKYEGSALSVVMILNPSPCRVVTHGLPDEAFLRDKVPMTKEEVREVSVSKLRLTDDSVIYDVGAGSGSVSIEMALQACQGCVYAIEKNPTAVDLLGRNKQRFCADNLEIVEGLAPDAMEELPAPTHAFIGGSSGNLKQILECLLAKNPEIRVVINAITLETVGEALEALRELPFGDVDIASVSTAKSKEIGRYHMMLGQNPVYVIAASGLVPQE